MPYLSFSTIQSIQIFAHATATLLWWHVQIFVVIPFLELSIRQFHWISNVNESVREMDYIFDCYASAFRRRRHYVFGLSVRPSVRLSIRPSVRSLKYPLLTCTWVRWSTRPTVTVLWYVRPSVRPSVKVSRHLPENAWREWPEILHADVSWPPSELISSGSRSVDFCNFGTILTWWNGSNLGFPGISWRTHGGNGLKYGMLLYPDHLQNW